MLSRTFFDLGLSNLRRRPWDCTAYGGARSTVEIWWCSRLPGSEHPAPALIGAYSPTTVRAHAFAAPHFVTDHALAFLDGAGDQPSCGGREHRKLRREGALSIAFILTNE